MAVGASVAASPERVADNRVLVCWGFWTAAISNPVALGSDGPQGELPEVIAMSPDGRFAPREAKSGPK